LPIPITIPIPSCAHTVNFSAHLCIDIVIVDV